MMEYLRSRCPGNVNFLETQIKNLTSVAKAYSELLESDGLTLIGLSEEQNEMFKRESSERIILGRMINICEEVGIEGKVAAQIWLSTDPGVNSSGKYLVKKIVDMKPKILEQIQENT
jgi:hypothetical protein